jgi:hypothetical protein
MAIYAITTVYPQKGKEGPLIYRGFGFTSKQILLDVLLKEFETEEIPNWRAFIAKEFVLEPSKEIIVC